MKTITPKDIQPGILYIDQREPLRIAEKLAIRCPIPVEVRTLQTGDYVVEDVAIERKTADDLCMSIMSKKKYKDGRVWTQSDRMMRDFRKKYILVTGNLDDRTSKIHIHSLLGGLARLYVEDIQVMTGLGDEDDFVYFLLKLLEKDGKLKMFPSRKKKKS